MLRNLTLTLQGLRASVKGSKVEMNKSILLLTNKNHLTLYYFREKLRVMHGEVLLPLGLWVCLCVFALCYYQPHQKFA